MHDYFFFFLSIVRLIHSTKAKSRDIIPVAINPCKNQPMVGINATHHGTNGTNMHTKTVITIIGIHSYRSNILIKVENKNDFIFPTDISPFCAFSLSMYKKVLAFVRGLSYLSDINLVY